MSDFTNTYEAVSSLINKGTDVFCKADDREISFRDCCLKSASGSHQACQTCEFESGLYTEGMKKHGALSLCQHALSLAQNSETTALNAVEAFRGLTRLVSANGMTLTECLSKHKFAPGRPLDDFMVLTLELQATIDEFSKDGKLDEDEVKSFLKESLPKALQFVLDLHYKTDPKADQEKWKNINKHISDTIETSIAVASMASDEEKKQD